MAEATNNLKVNTNPVETGTVDLKLTGPEARALRAILGRIGGDPAKTARRYADNIFYALNSVGVPNIGYDVELFESTSSTLYFNSNSLTPVDKVPK